MDAKKLGSYHRTASSPYAIRLVLGLLCAAVLSPPPAFAAEPVCAECHRENTRASHPIGMVPSMAVPADLPLDATGRMTCTTCHWHHDRITVTGDGRRSLRRPAIHQLCAGCHRGEMVFNHRGHLPFAHAAGRAARSVDARGMDRRSLACLGCHDNLHPTIGAERAALAGGQAVTASHPIGVELSPHASGSGAPRSWHMNIDPRIALFDGRVGCPSCHDPFSTAPNKLVMPTRGSALCLACHAI